MQKIKKHHFGFISSQNGTGQAERDTKKKKKLSFQSIPTRSGIKNPQKIAKECKNFKNIIMASFQAKTVRDWLRMIIKKKVIVPIHSNPYLNREFQKNSKKLKNIAVAFFQAKTGRDRLIMREKKLKK